MVRNKLFTKCDRNEDHHLFIVGVDDGQVERFSVRFVERRKQINKRTNNRNTGENLFTFLKKKKKFLKFITR